MQSCTRRPANCCARNRARAATAVHAVPRAGQWCMLIVGSCTTGRALLAYCFPRTLVGPSKTMTTPPLLVGSTSFFLMVLLGFLPIARCSKEEHELMNTWNPPTHVCGFLLDVAQVQLLVSATAETLILLPRWIRIPRWDATQGANQINEVLNLVKPIRQHRRLVGGRVRFFRGRAKNHNVRRMRHVVPSVERVDVEAFRQFRCARLRCTIKQEHLAEGPPSDCAATAANVGDLRCTAREDTQ